MTTLLGCIVAGELPAQLVATDDPATYDTATYDTDDTVPALVAFRLRAEM